LKIDKVPLLADFSFDIKKLLRSVKNSKIAFFATPNNPTGTTIDIDGIEEVLRIKNSIVVVDEAYYEFHGLTCQRLLDRYENLLILRTFSKAFGIAGVRLGYLLCNPDIAKHMVKAKPPFSIGIFQQVVAEYLLSKKGLVLDTVRKIVMEREKVFNRLKSIPEIMPIPSCANFILFGIKNYSSIDFFHRLYKKGILVRRFGGPDLKKFLRVTIGKPEENEEFIKKIKQIIKKPGGQNAQC
jgi:histidinol-phosphate aminotransferase